MAGISLSWVSVHALRVSLSPNRLLTNFFHTGALACDVPAHAYTYSWEGNPHWSRAYVGAEELYKYYEGRTEVYGVAESVRLNQHVTKAQWDGESGRWTPTINKEQDGTTLTDEAEIISSMLRAFSSMLVMVHLII
ncbi:hypothetical protein Z517_06074 [Fonsecaea pedrosoi CBS 271.37]|uniref:Uncharacterized protein n=1 Tax=Fonsecaea pedrosoi CBS 271.37 TaxID=1442368 RepID=A0A0D2EYX3_9EURO|nr:uncharacterized protein Z517_06074 [Fonsecaea pedrosoi CBS 271.37]KIW79462.1 hypothetical protein Z517_06074 [Fonsecaea pedrosoi CBS 271.37]